MAQSNKNSNNATKPNSQEPPLGASLSDLLNVLANASPEEKAQLAKLFPQQQVPTAPSQMTMDDQLRLLRVQGQMQDRELSAQMVVMQLGSVSHPAGWEPRPPEWVSERGEEAEKRWLIKWYNGDSFGSQEQFMREHDRGVATQLSAKSIEMLDTLEANVDNIEGSGIVYDVTNEQSYLSMANDKETAQSMI